MRHAWLIALAIVAGAGAIAYGLLILSGEMRHVSDELDVVARDLSSMTDDVRSLADDVSALADALTGEDSDDEQQSPIAVDVAGDRRPALGGELRVGHGAGIEQVARAAVRRSRAVARRPRDPAPHRRWISAAPLPPR